MTLSQQKFREMVFQMLYSYDLGHPDEEVILELMMAELTVTKKNVKLAQNRVQQILQKLPEIDPLIASVSTSYDFERIQTVTKNILRLGTFELFFDSEIPPKVAIAEAMRLARKFGTPESASFINALLDQLYRMSQGGQLDAKLLKDQTEALRQSEEMQQRTAEEMQQRKLEENPE